MLRARPWLVVSAIATLSCGPAEAPTSAVATAVTTAKTAGAPPALAATTAGANTGAAAVTAAPSVDPTPLLKPAALTMTQALDVAYPAGAPSEAERCKAQPAAGADARAADEAAVRCLLRVRFSGDDAARDMAIGFYDKLGAVTGVIREHDMDGGWRGQLHLVPELPVGQYRKHLQWVKSGFEDIDAFFAGLDAKRARGTEASYRYKALGFRFFRSVGRTTPSAYAQGWEVSYNVSGSLHANAAAVRETLFHEVFHSNDSAHGSWSDKALTKIVDAIIATCDQKTACLTPYAPGTTMVRGGTYYAFQKGNGVGEYAAELATRYFLEHHAILEGKRHGKAPFKCGPPENMKSWTLLVNEFFGVDLTPECGK